LLVKTVRIVVKLSTVHVESWCLLALPLTVNCMSSGRLRGTLLSNCNAVWAGYKPWYL